MPQKSSKTGASLRPCDIAASVDQIDFSRGTRVVDRRGTRGVTTGGSYPCPFSTCDSVRIGIRWDNGKLSFPCLADIDAVPAHLQVNL